MPTYRMKLISEPDPDSMRIVVPEDESPAIKGEDTEGPEGDIFYTCGQCDLVLIDSIIQTVPVADLVSRQAGGK